MRLISRCAAIPSLTVLLALVLLSFGCTVRRPPAAERAAGARGTSSWEQLPTPPAGSVRCMTRTLDGGVLAGTTGGMYASRDEGTTWAFTGLPAAEALLTTRTGTVLAGTYRDGVFRSEDRGKSWLPVGFDRNVYIFSIVQSTDGAIYLSATESVDHEPQGVFRSRDDGRTWVPAGLAMNEVYSLSALPGGSSGQ